MKRVRVLVADDSAVVRDALCGILAAEPDLEVVGTAADGLEVVARARALRPDVITMDVEMPGQDGLDAIGDIMAEAPCRILVVSAVDRERQQDLSMRAVAAGALEIVPKPRTGRPDELAAFARRLATSIRLMAEVPVIQRRRDRRSWLGDPLPAPTEDVHSLGLVASTGGPPVLATLLERLPEALPFPVLVAQHIAAGFGAGLLRWFQSVTSHPVVFAMHGEPCRPGTIYLARDGHHLAVAADRTTASLADDGGGSCPSGDRLLVSLAAAYGRHAAGAVLTGMGDDGAQGLAAIARAGGVTAAQSEASCAVYGMPRAAVALGAAQTQLSPTGLASWIRSLALRG